MERILELFLKKYRNKISILTKNFRFINTYKQEIDSIIRLSILFIKLNSWKMLQIEIKMYNTSVRKIEYEIQNKIKEKIIYG